MVPGGGKVVVRIPHDIPADLGEQKVHVTLKDGNGKRIERQVVSASRIGTLELTFAIPTTVSGGKVSFAAFLGEEYTRNLQHLASGLIPVK